MRYLSPVNAEYGTDGATRASIGSALRCVPDKLEQD